MIGGMYVLDGHTPVLEHDLIRWASFMESGGRSVAFTGNEQLRVSTVFLGLDHGFGGEPILFESMVFGGAHDGEQLRCATWEEAERGHRVLCERVFGRAVVGAVRGLPQC